MNRRTVLKGLAGAATVVFAGGHVRAGAPGAAPAGDVEALRRDWRLLLPEGADVPDESERVAHSDDAWRARLTAAQYDVLRESDTERAFSSPLNAEKRAGVYACAGCGLPLFTSAMKFDSGTGWPSFFTTIPGAFETERDWLLLFPRTEYHCVRCGGHHGHVFDDGPPPTHERWCNNGVALTFLPK
jgi:peptide-methionine (R)-S-oxide reductase